MARWDLIDRAMETDSHLARARADLASALVRRELRQFAQLHRDTTSSDPLSLFVHSDAEHARLEVAGARLSA